MKTIITLQTNFWNTSPSVDLLLNNKIVKQINEFESDKEKIVSFEEKNTELKNELTIRRKGKLLSDTIVSNGNIVKDSLVTVKDIVIDKISIKPLLHKAIFFPKYPEPWYTQQKQMKNMPPDSYSYTDILHHNGEWKLQFELPIHIWFFQNINVSI